MDQEAAVHAGVGDAVTFLVGDAREGNRALGPDFGLDASGGESLRKPLGDLAHFVLTLGDGLPGL
jgi:hypothetical protein